MKKLFLICILLVPSLTFAVAQQIGTARGLTREEVDAFVELAQKQADEKMALLSLSAEQQTKIHAIDFEIKNIHSEKLKKVLGDMVAQIALRYEIIQLEEEKYKPVLSAKQFEKLQEYYAPIIKDYERILRRFRAI